MSDTPRTDKAETDYREWRHKVSTWASQQEKREAALSPVPDGFDFARALERTIAAQAKEIERLREVLGRLVSIVPEPELVYSADHPPEHRTMEEHELGYALHLARRALGDDK